jgi:hypothetical protein
MLELARFARYALRFERAFRDDRWGPVEDCFARDATYTITGTATRYDGETRGAHAIVQLFKYMLDEVDRKYDKRSPRPRGLPRVTGGEVVVPWAARYTIGDRGTTLTGESRCRFAAGKIAALSDAMVANEVRAWMRLVGVS